MKQLIAIRVGDLSRASKILGDVWADGHASIVLDPLAPPAQAAALLQSIEPDAIVHDTPDGTHSRVRRLPGGGVSRLPSDTATLVATSGSTGAPRVIVLTDEAVAAATRASLQRLACAPTAQWLLCLPLHHIAGQLVLRRAGVLGTQPEVVSQLTPDHASTLTSTHWSLVPTMLARLVSDSVDMRGRTILLGGAAASADLLAGAQQLGAKVTTTYGMTETTGGCVYDGVPLDGIEVQIGPAGRIQLRGPQLAVGELRGRAIVPVTDANGWLHTNDVGSLVDGRLEIRGRADAVIISGGENIPAEPVEHLIRQMPGVDDAVVVGVDDDEWGQVVVALIEANDTQAADLDGIRTAVAERLGRAAAPRHVLQIDQLPRTSLGKPARGEAAELASALLRSP